MIGESPSELIDGRIRELGDWRGAMLARLRALIKEAAPDVTEEWKWRGVPVWYKDGMICTGETYRNAVKLTFAKGAALPDPTSLFNASLEGNVRRAIDFHEGGKVDEAAFKALIRAAIALNGSKAPRKAKPQAAEKEPVRLLAGGNPQIPKGDGDAPVAAYIAAMPGWKRALGERLDAVITRALPQVSKAVKWNSPLYGVKGQGWFLSFHTFTHYVKVTFFQGASLRPLPPRESRSAAVRSIDIGEEDALDEAQFEDWVRQAAALPGYLDPRS
jgi:hypothetical protein